MGEPLNEEAKAQGFPGWHQRGYLPSTLLAGSRRVAEATERRLLVGLRQNHRQGESILMGDTARLEPEGPPLRQTEAASAFERAKPTASRRSAHLSRPPYNPGLHQLVDGKQAWANPLNEEAKAQGFPGWHQRGYLPSTLLAGSRRVAEATERRLLVGLPRTTSKAH